MCVCIETHAQLSASVRGIYMRLLDPLELEVQAALSHLMWVRRMQLRFSSRAGVPLHHRAISMSPVLQLWLSTLFTRHLRAGAIPMLSFVSLSPVSVASSVELLKHHSISLRRALGVGPPLSLTLSLNNTTYSTQPTVY